MLVWDYEWRQPNEAKIDPLTPVQRLNLSLACIDDALQILGPIYCRDLSENVGLIASVAWGELWSVDFDAEDTVAAVQSHVNGLESCLERMDPTETAESGFYDTISGFLEIIAGVSNGMPVPAVIATASFGYQAIMEVGILGKLEREMTEFEVRDLEKANAKCMACIDHQLEFLKLVTAGETISKKTVL